MKPIRIQRKRIKGWRMPQNTVYVGRPTIFRNPFIIDGKKVFSQSHSVMLFTIYLENKKTDVMFWRAMHTLEGKNLACWCKLSEKCHADVLLKIVNS